MVFIAIILILQFSFHDVEENDMSKNEFIRNGWYIMCEVQTNRIKSLLGPRTTNAFLRQETLPNIPFCFDLLPYIGQKCKEKMLAISPFLLSFFLFAKLLLVETSEDCNVKWQ